jgi:hypothetical protein
MGSISPRAIVPNAYFLIDVINLVTGTARIGRQVGGRRIRLVIYVGNQAGSRRQELGFGARS